MKFVLLVEGDTENLAAAGFLKRWLDPRLASPIEVKVVKFQGNAQFLRKYAARAEDYLDAPEAQEIVAVVGLLDLYGLDIYPPAITTAEDRHDWAVQELERRVGRPKFRMFFAVHEIEAWILSQPEVLPRPVRDKLPKSARRPEKVDFDEPPAKLLNRLYLSGMGRNYKKTTYGRQLFARLDPEVTADKCPYLNAMLATMLSLAQAAGQNHAT